MMRCVIQSGPLLAVIDAQAKAAATTVKFIQAMGFDADGHARTVDFGYSTTNATTGVVQEKKLRVPLLTIVPIPFIRVSAVVAVLLRCLCHRCHHRSSRRVLELQVAELNIEYNAKVTGMTSHTDESDTTSTSSKTSYRGWWSRTRTTTSVVHKTHSKNTNKEEREFTLKVQVKAVQEDAPAGLQKVLSVLEEAILKK
jgi:Protein of unknown function (DUF2589)